MTSQHTALESADYKDKARIRARSPKANASANGAIDMMEKLSASLATPRSGEVTTSCPR